MAKLIWTAAAFANLEGIRKYIAKNSPAAAVRVANEIYKRTEDLQKFPRLGYLDHEETEGEVRVLVYGHYRISYLVDGDAVVIVGVQHTSRRRSGRGG